MDGDSEIFLCTVHTFTCNNQKKKETTLFIRPDTTSSLIFTQGSKYRVVVEKDGVHLLLWQYIKKYKMSFYTSFVRNPVTIDLCYLNVCYVQISVYLGLYWWQRGQWKLLTFWYPSRDYSSITTTDEREREGEWKLYQMTPKIEFQGVP